MHRTLDVLDRVLTHILKHAGHLSFDVVANHFGQATPPDGRERLDSSGDVDTLAIDVVALDHDFAKIDTDAVADALGFGDFRLRPFPSHLVSPARSSQRR